MPKNENRIYSDSSLHRMQRKKLYTQKNKRNDSQRMELKKFCPAVVDRNSIGKLDNAREGKDARIKTN